MCWEATLLICKHVHFPVYCILTWCFTPAGVNRSRLPTCMGGDHGARTWSSRIEPLQCWGLTIIILLYIVSMICWACTISASWFWNFIVPSGASHWLSSGWTTTVSKRSPSPCATSSASRFWPLTTICATLAVFSKSLKSGLCKYDLALQILHDAAIPLQTFMYWFVKSAFNWPWKLNFWYKFALLELWIFDCIHKFACFMCRIENVPNSLFMGCTQLQKVRTVHNLVGTITSRAVTRIGMKTLYDRIKLLRRFLRWGLQCMF